MSISPRRVFRKRDCPPPPVDSGFGCFRFVLYIDANLQPMVRIRARPGQIFHTMNTYSMFTGIAPERRAFKLLGIPAIHKFWVDKTHLALRFSNRNGTDLPFQHLITDVPVLCVDRMWLLLVAWWHISIPNRQGPGLSLDFMLGGISCKPLSLTLASRKSESGTQLHEQPTLPYLSYCLSNQELP